MKKTKKKSNYYNEITDKIIDYIKENNEVPWQNLWKNKSNRNSFSFSVSPYNPVTGTIYGALNEINLMTFCPEAKEDPRFLTFNNIKNAGFKLKKGSKANKVYFLAPVTKKEKVKDDILGEVELETEIFVIKAYNVFHAKNIEGLPPYEIPKEYKEQISEHDPYERMKKLINHDDIVIRTGGNKAFYKPSEDYIQMPDKDQFISEDSFYSVLLHEIGHWTKKEGRVFRPRSLDKKDYAAEELVAELFSLAAAPKFNVTPNFTNSAEYIKGWISVLDNDKQFLFRASSFAERCTDYCLKMIGHEKLKKITPQIKIKTGYELSELSFPIYGKSKEELEPYIKDLLEGKTTDIIEGFIGKKEIEFSASIKLQRNGQKVVVKIVEFGLKKEQEKENKKEINNTSNLEL